jgi:hypothetical protein
MKNMIKQTSPTTQTTRMMTFASACFVSFSAVLAAAGKSLALSELFAYLLFHIPNLYSKRTIHQRQSLPEKC